MLIWNIILSFLSVFTIIFCIVFYARMKSALTKIIGPDIDKIKKDIKILASKL